MSFDSEEAHLIDRIQASVYYQAKQAGASFISIAWVPKKLRRSKTWVKENWKKKPADCFTDFSKAGRPVSLSQETKNIIKASVGVKTRVERLMQSAMFDA